MIAAMYSSLKWMREDYGSMTRQEIEADFRLNAEEKRSLRIKL
jgi:hypothetical protein